LEIGSDIELEIEAPLPAPDNAALQHADSLTSAAKAGTEKSQLLRR
jgi:hypothetical protein